MLPEGFEVPATVKDHFKDWKLEDWKVEHREGPAHPLGMPMTITTYTSPTIKLMTGESAFTLNPTTAIPFPKGDYTIVRADFYIVNDEGAATTPLSEVYNHHWLLGTTSNINPLAPCEDNLFFGAGAEMRGMPNLFPHGYGMIRIGAKGRCGGNLHFIRTEDLATNWTGLNDPQGDIGAAVKNCVECGWAPGRAMECLKALDGTYACCLGGARCPVNHPEDKSTKSYRLQYNVQWTKDLSQLKNIGGGVLDVSNGLTEWNVAPNMKPTNPHSLKHQTCDDKVCNATFSWTVKSQEDFGSGICPGNMIWAYLHQHAGAIRGEMWINGEKICTSKPIHGTDPNNAPGNEKGYVVAFTPCIDRDNLWNSTVPSSPDGVVNKEIRLNSGDVVTVTALYDVDVDSKACLPQPGGKHGGVMGLYFYQMDCDPGSFATKYVCRQDTCIPQPVGEYDTLEDCQTAQKAGQCGAAATYRCVDGQCQVSDNGVSKDVCESAC